MISYVTIITMVRTPKNIITTISKIMKTKKIVREIKQKTKKKTNKRENKKKLKLLLLLRKQWIS